MEPSVRLGPQSTRQSPQRPRNGKTPVSGQIENVKQTSAAIPARYRMVGTTAERQTKQQPRRDSRQQPPKHNDNRRPASERKHSCLLQRRSSRRCSKLAVASRTHISVPREVACKSLLSGARREIVQSRVNVRFTPKSGHRGVRSSCPLCATPKADIGRLTRSSRQQGLNRQFVSTYLTIDAPL
jgi:hypothetical protein